MGYRLSELLYTNLSSSYHVSDNDNADKRIPGTQTTSFSFGLNRSLEEIFRTLSGNMSLGFTRSEYPSSETRSYSLSIGTGFMATEIIQVSLSGGLTYIESEYLTVQLVPTIIPGFFFLEEVEAHSTKTDYRSSISISRSRETGSQSFSFAHSVASADERQTATIRDSISFAFSRPLSERLNSSLTVSYTINQSDAGEFSESATDVRTFQLSTNVSYQLTQAMTLSVRYSFRNVDDRVEGDSPIQNTLTVSLGWGATLID